MTSDYFFQEVDPKYKFWNKSYYGKIAQIFEKL